jgi:hypothetical protein
VSSLRKDDTWLSRHIVQQNTGLGVGVPLSSAFPSGGRGSQQRAWPGRCPLRNTPTFRSPVSQVRFELSTSPRHVQELLLNNSFKDERAAPRAELDSTSSLRQTLLCADHTTTCSLSRCTPAILMSAAKTVSLYLSKAHTVPLTSTLPTSFTSHCGKNHRSYELATATRFVLSDFRMTYSHPCGHLAQSSHSSTL